MHATQHVTYNGGAGREKEFALIAKDHGGGSLDLIILTESGNQFEAAVPHREPSDYGPEGGGRTWHEG